ncbi:T9SS type A sorting domain-containing protein [Hymenobacter sediminicola]|uniref:T9SS type A sorting domain-containing protein n=1 Tax=Hymenobacter sediminicola TaxID=2761579 RepID=A0A7G7W7I5_9BACT|nr:T9SS type A sorting domain-containing protein [Hymenobacter sediminicola]QNH62328.1 T9SS type A sorting domain-containing protein [Hymenobacter sediminicola]
MKHLSTLIYSSLLVLFLLTVTIPVAQAQVPAWQTAVGTAGTSISVKATAATANDEVIVVGDFANTATFGNTTFTSTGTGNDGFVAKWSNSASRFVWAHQISGTAGGEYPLSVAVSGSSVYVGGVFSGRMVIIGTNFLTNADVFGNTDLFFAKIVDAGTTSSVVWAQRAGGQSSEDLAGLVATGSTLYAAGTFRGTTTTLGALSLTNASSTGSNIFVTKLTDAGSTSSFTWAQQAGGSVGVDLVKAIAVTGNSIYIAGQYSGTSTRFGTTTLPNAGNADLFVAKLTDAGSAASFTWAQQAGGTGYEVVNALAVEGSTVYLTGYFGSPTLAIGTSNLSNAGSLDVFVAKLTDAGSAGSFAWGQQAGGSGSDMGSALAVRGSNVYVTGYHSSPDARFGSTQLTTAGQSDVFLTKLTDAGNSGSFAWTQQAGGSSLDNGVAVVLQGSRLYVAGVFDSPSIAFGTLALTKPSTGYGLFLASLTDGTLSSADAVLSGSAFAIFPNPAHTTATIILPALPGAAHVTFMLTDGLGRAVRTGSVPMPATGLRHEFSVAGLPAGLYFLRVQAGHATASRCLVVAL